MTLLVYCPSTEGQRQADPERLLARSLAKKESFWFSKRLCFEAIRKKGNREDNTLLLSDTHTEIKK